MPVKRLVLHYNEECKNYVSDRPILHLGNNYRDPSRPQRKTYILVDLHCIVESVRFAINSACYLKELKCLKSSAMVIVIRAGQSMPIYVYCG